MPQMHSRPTPAGRAYWRTERLWALAADLPVEQVAVADIAELGEDCWFPAVRFLTTPPPDTR